MSRRRALAWLIALGAGALRPGTAGAQDRPPTSIRVEVRGNVALPTELYQTVACGLEHRAEGHADRLDQAVWAATSSVPSAIGSSTVAPGLELRAAEVEERIQSFLLDAGYQLARVRASVVGDHVEVELDEGRLDKVIFIAQGAFRAFELRILLDLPGRVFNAPLVRQRLDEIKAAYNVEKVSYELVRVIPLGEGETHYQIDRPALVRVLSLDAYEQPYELRVYLDSRERSRGLDLNVQLGPPDGVVFGATYGARSVFVRRDAVNLGALFGFRPTDALDVRRTRSSLSRVRAFGEWLTQTPIDLVKVGFLLDADLRGRVRTDLGLDSYYDLAFRASAVAELDTSERFALRLAVGTEVGFLPNQEGIPGVPIAPEVNGADALRVRPFASLTGRMRWNPGEVRLDRTHELKMSLLGVAQSFDGKPYAAASIAYRRAIPFGWNEFRFKSEARAIVGSPGFFDQFPLYELAIRGGFGDVFVYRGLAASAEYRFSLTRDLMKLGVFVEGGLAHGIYPDTEVLRAIVGAGLSLHFLVIDTFLFDLYGGVGVSGLPDRPLNLGISILVSQAF